MLLAFLYTPLPYKCGPDPECDQKYKRVQLIHDFVIKAPKLTADLLDQERIDFDMRTIVIDVLDLTISLVTALKYRGTMYLMDSLSLVSLLILIKL